jgi:hypothetical protein
MASAHAARNAQAKRGAANEDHNTLLTALIHEGGIQQKKETWKGALDKARYKIRSDVCQYARLSYTLRIRRQLPFLSLLSLFPNSTNTQVRKIASEFILQGPTVRTRQAHDWID